MGNQMENAMESSAVQCICKDMGHEVNDVTISSLNFILWLLLYMTPPKGRDGETPMIAG